MAAGIPFISAEFFCAYLVLLFVTGAFVPVSIAFVGALAISHVVRTYVTEKREPVPAKAAIVITGCSTGIGEDAALSLCNEGFVVFAVVRKQSDAESLVSKVSGEARSRLIPVKADITVREQLQSAAEQVKSELASRGLYLHALVNNAGISNSLMLELVTVETMRKQFEVNVFAQIAVTQAFLPFLRQPAPSAAALSRRIIFVSSAVGHLVLPTGVPYSSTKHALEAIVDGFRMELKSWGIEVLSLAPGAISTKFGDTAGDNFRVNFEAAKKARGGEFPVSDDVMQVYENMFNRATERRARQQGKGSTTAVTTEGLRHALLDKRPATRIPAGNDCVFGVPLLMWLPDRIRDAAMTLALRR